MKTNGKPMVHRSTLFHYELTIADGKTKTGLVDLSRAEENSLNIDKEVEACLDSLIMEAPDYLVKNILAIYGA